MADVAAVEMRHPVLKMSMPVGTVTFLLTDIEGSSRLWEGDDGSVGSAVARHYEILDGAIARHGGVRPVEQGEGDSVVAAFARAGDAVAAALDAQRALTEETWPTPTPLRVRMAVHTGDVQLRDAGNYMGSTLNRAARLRQLGHGGQVLVSRATEELLGGVVPSTAWLRDLGGHRLRDLGRPEQVFQLCHPDLPDAFPSLRSVDARPNNLPSQLTTFVGRDDEVAVLHKLLDADRLVTVTGSGGCGKTRIAVQVAAERLEQHPDGVWWVDLGPVGDPTLVANAVADAARIREAPGESLVSTLCRVLASRRVLLIVDNCEHVIDAAATVCHSLLQECPSLTVLATSREPLGVDGETTWRVPSLEVPQPGVPLEDASGHDAVRLFVDRATRARPTFELTDETVGSVVEICQRLEGVPLAIELAAARVRVMAPSEIAAGLQDRFRLLGGGARTALPRQRTLEASVDWSWNLLTDELRLLFRRLAVFAGSFALDSAEVVCADDALGEYEIFDLLLQLVDRSLVQAEERGGRYRMLETVRHYALRRLLDAGEADAVRHRHLAHLVSLIERTQPLVEEGGTAAGLDRLELDADNIRAALDWSVAAGRAVDGLRLATVWPEHWAFSGRMPEGVARIQALVEAAEPEGDLLARALVALQTIAAYGAVDLGGSSARGRRGLALARDVGDEQLAARALVYIGFAEGMLDPASASTHLEAARAASVAAGDAWAARHATNWIGFNRLATGDVAGARDLFWENADAARGAGDLIGLRTALYFMGVCSWQLGEPRRAAAEMREAVEVAASARDRLWVPMIETLLSIVITSLGDYESSESLIQRALEDAADTSNPFARALALWALAWRRAATGDVSEAKVAASEGSAVFAVTGPPWAAAICTGLLAWATASSGDPRGAVRAADDAVARAASSPAMGFALLMKAHVARAGGALDVAEEAARQSVMQGVHVLSTSDALEALGGVLVARGDADDGVRLLAAGVAARENTDLRRWASLEPTFLADIAAAREILGDDAFADTWAKGATQSAEEAVACASRGRGARRRPSAGWDSLTPTEVEVVRLVAEGLTNPQIGERLFVSRGTVKTHLAHVFAKVGVSTRAELATEATRRQA
jgi:predicted ATPase/class 3 adenylate cyclase/DNA-binding CsgD family transcriptional regulator